MSGTVLVCFAVPQEAKPFRKLIRNDSRNIRVLVTGMGPRNAERAIKAAIQEHAPTLVFTCGFAGALSPELKIGDLVCPEHAPVSSGKAVRFVVTERVAVTAAEKASLHSQGADAVEMESATIARICAEAGLPCRTLRAISDEANEDLPLDFNELLGADDNLNALKLAWAILKAPHKIPSLLRLGENSAVAAERLAHALLAEIPKA